MVLSLFFAATSEYNFCKDQGNNDRTGNVPAARLHLHSSLLQMNQSWLLVQGVTTAREEPTKYDKASTPNMMVLGMENQLFRCQ